MRIEFSKMKDKMFLGLGGRVSILHIDEEDVSPLTVVYKNANVQYERKRFKDLRIEPFEGIDHGFIVTRMGIFLGWSFEEDTEAYVPLQWIYWFMNFLENLTDMRAFEENLEFFLPEKADYPLVLVYPAVKGSYLMFAAPQYTPELPQEGWE